MHPPAANGTALAARHPITLVIEEIVAICHELGFTIALGPEVETDHRMSKRTTGLGARRTLQITLVS